MTFEEFKNRLDKATKEEVVKETYASYFKLKYDTSHHHHLYIFLKNFLSLRRTLVGFVVVMVIKILD